MLRGWPAFGARLPAGALAVRFQAAVLPIQMGKLWFLIGALCVVVALCRRLTPREPLDARWPWSRQHADAARGHVGARPAVFLTNHASYFEHSTITILLTFPFWRLGFRICRPWKVLSDLLLSWLLHSSA